MKIYGLIGYPLGHSFSKKFFTEKFQAEHIDAEYLNFEITDIGLLPEIISSHPNLMGFNVTIPYKEQVIPFLHELSTEARAVGAVNVVKINRLNNELHLVGYNSDVFGFRESIASLIVPERHHHALILGTGGASKAVRQGLSQLGIESTFVSRTPKPNQLTYSDLTKEVINKHTVIVNSTPLGTYPKTEVAPPIPYEFLTKNHLLFDLVYNPSETLFLRFGKAEGATIKNGADMLRLQAEEAWRMWQG